MPCRDWEEADKYTCSPSNVNALESEIKHLRAKLDQLTSMVCANLQHLESNFPGYNVIHPVELAKWWHEHKQEDERRRQYEESQKPEARAEQDKKNKLAQYTRLKQELGL